MQITDYKYLHGVDKRKDYFAIPTLNRQKSSVLQFIKLANLNIELTKPSAFLYIDGFSMSPSEMGTAPVEGYKPVIKTGTAYIVHEWISTFKNKNNLMYVDSISSTCAAGIHAFYTANELLKKGIIEDVIIIGGERTTEDTIRLFKELNIPIICGDGFVYLRLSKGNQVMDIKWKYSHEPNPFHFRKETLDTLIPKYPVDFVKLHGTGTKSNREAESGLEKLGKPIIYKPSIGHTQGISAALETCILMSNPAIKGRILITANGFGGYYGCMTLYKNA